MAGLALGRGIFFFVAVAVTGVIAGLMVAVQIGQVPVQRGLDARDFVLVKQRFEHAFGPKMPPLVAASLIAPIPLHVTAAGGTLTSIVLVAIGHVASILVLVITAKLNLPVNRAAVTWTVDAPPENWEAMRSQWHRGHALRLPPALIAFGCHLAAAIVE